MTRDQSDGGQGSASLPRQLVGGRRQGVLRSGGGGGRMLSGEPKGAWSQVWRSQGSGAGRRSGVRLPEDEHFRVLKGGDERDWH